MLQRPEDATVDEVAARLRADKSKIAHSQHAHRALGAGASRRSEDAKDQTTPAISISVKGASAILHSQHAKLGVLAPTGILTLAARLEDLIRSPVEQLSHDYIFLSDLFMFSVWSALCR